MQHIIKPVKKLVEKMMADKAFMPVEMKYPGFTVTTEDYVHLMEDYLQTKIHVKVDSKQYKSKFLLNQNEDFTDIIKADMSPETNVRMKQIINEALPGDIERDVDLSKPAMQSHARTSILKGMSQHLKSQFLQINILENSYPDERNPLEKVHAISTTASMIICIKHNNPIAYRELQQEFNLNPLQETVKEVMKEVNAPSSLTIDTLLKFDRHLVQEHYGAEFMKMQQMNEKSNEVMRGEQLRNKIVSFRKDTPAPKKRFFSFS